MAVANAGYSISTTNRCRAPPSCKTCSHKRAPSRRPGRTDRLAKVEHWAILMWVAKSAVLRESRAHRLPGLRQIWLWQRPPLLDPRLRRCRQNHPNHSTVAGRWVRTPPIIVISRQVTAATKSASFMPSLQTQRRDLPPSVRHGNVRRRPRFRPRVRGKIPRDRPTSTRGAALSTPQRAAPPLPLHSRMPVPVDKRISFASCQQVVGECFVWQHWWHVLGNEHSWLA